MASWQQTLSLLIVLCMCSHANAVAVCVQGAIRLVGGSSNMEGRVEVCNSGEWGTVCDDGFGTNDANVACSQLGFSNTGSTARCCASYGRGSGSIVLDDLACTGSETSLFSCPHSGVYVHNCGHSEDVGVVCLSAATCTQGDIRLVGGSNERQGRVEVCNDNAWGTVCDDSFGTNDANVGCRQLGFSGTGAIAQCCANYGQGSGSIVLDNLACTGSENSLFSCPHRGLNSHNCGHSEDVGVTCQGSNSTGDVSSGSSTSVITGVTTAGCIGLICCCVCISVFISLVKRNILNLSAIRTVSTRAGTQLNNDCQNPIPSNVPSTDIPLTTYPPECKLQQQPPPDYSTSDDYKTASMPPAYK